MRGKFTVPAAIVAGVLLSLYAYFSVFYPAQESRRTREFQNKAQQ